MENRNYSCARCKKSIIRSVESCGKCVKDFHPCCIKAHKIYDINGHLVPCDGIRELFNLNTTGNKEFKRRSTYEYEIESSQDQNMNANVNKSNLIFNFNNNNNNQHNKHVSQIDNTKDNINNKIDELSIDDICLFKDEVKDYIKDELNSLKDVVTSVIVEEISKVTEI